MGQDYEREKGGMESTAAEKCFGCNKFFIQKYSLENQKNFAV